MEKRNFYSQRKDSHEDASIAKIVVAGVEHDARELEDYVDMEMRRMREILHIDKWNALYEKSYRIMLNYYGVDMVGGEPTAFWSVGVIYGKYRERWPDKFCVENLSYKTELLYMKQVLIEECAKPKPDLWCMWDLAVLYNYGRDIKDCTLNKDIGRTLELLHEIRARRGELTNTPTDDVISELLDDWLFYIGNDADVKAEIYWNFQKLEEENRYASGFAFYKGEWFERYILSELPGATMKEGFHIGKCKYGETEMSTEWRFDEHYLFVFDESGRVYDEDVFSYIEFQDSSMGRLCHLLLLWLMVPAMVDKGREKEIFNICHIDIPERQNSSYFDESWKAFDSNEPNNSDNFTYVLF